MAKSNRLPPQTVGQAILRLREDTCLGLILQTDDAIKLINFLHKARELQKYKIIMEGDTYKTTFIKR